MSILADQHLHSSFSGDSTEPMENIAEAAMQRGLAHITFTEHMDMGYPVTEDAPEGTFLLNADSYIYDFLRTRFKYDGRLSVRLGVEIGLDPRFIKELNTFAGTNTILSSVPPTWQTVVTPTIPIFLKAAAKKKPSGNIFWRSLRI